MANDSGPLSKAQIDELIVNIRKMDKVIEEIDRALRAGVDVKAEKERAVEAKQQMLRIKGEYAPTRSI